MASITLHRKQLLKIALPYWVLVNGNIVGIMRTKEVRIVLPEGNYSIEVRVMFKLLKWTFFIGGKREVDVDRNQQLDLYISDKERLWNVLFDIDLALWIAEFFIQLPSPWDIVYKCLSNGFFLLWIIRIIIIRKRYFIIDFKSNFR
ncbi:MAG: hypothetical protein ACI3ZZ_05480 [Candidatus Aphodosoma sp.]